MAVFTQVAIEELNHFLSQYNIPALKVPSASLNDTELLLAMKGTNLPIILSTGMSNLNEIKEALKVLISNGTKKKNITILQCNTEYPTPLKDANIKAMLTIKKRFLSCPIAGKN